MTPSELYELERTATKGPWRHRCSVSPHDPTIFENQLLRPGAGWKQSVNVGTGDGTYEEDGRDAALIVALRNNASALIDVALAAEKREAICREPSGDGLCLCSDDCECRACRIVTAERRLSAALARLKGEK